MATEALAADRTAEGHVEEVKLTNDMVDVTKESCPEPKDLEGKDEEKIKVDYSAAEEVSASKSKATIISEEKLEDGNNEPQAEGVKIDCSVTENPVGKYEKTLKVEDSEVGNASKEKQEDEKSEFVAEEVKKEEVEDETPKQEADFSTTDSKEEAVSSAAVEPTVEAVTPEPANQSMEVSTADLESTLVQESESETSKEPAILEAPAEEANATEELPQVLLEPVTEPLIASELVTEPSEPVTEVKETESSEPVAEVRATEPSIDSKDLSKQEESSCNVSETLTKELKDEGEGAIVAEEVPNVPEVEKVYPSVSIGTNSVTESVESLVKLEDKVEEEMLEKAVVAEEPTVTNTAKSEVEKKDGSLEGENTTLVETFRDIDVQEGKNNVNTEADNSVSKDTEKDDEKTPIEPAKDIGDAPKMEVRSKSSHRQSNSMFSKVKQSIVKVKKAIIGKSPSSKTISSEAKDEVKVK